MQRLAGIFLEVGTGQADPILVSLVPLPDLDRDAADDDRQFELADLVALGRSG